MGKRKDVVGEPEVGQLSAVDIDEGIDENLFIDGEVEEVSDLPSDLSCIDVPHKKYTTAYVTAALLAPFPYYFGLGWWIVIAITTFALVRRFTSREQSESKNAKAKAEGSSEWCCTVASIHH